MTRWLVAAVVVATVVFGIALPEPDPGPEPLGNLVLATGTRTDDGAVVYCPWAQANASRDSTISVGTIDQAVAAFTFPISLPGEEAATASLETFGPGAASLTLSDVVQRGDAPSIIEFSDDEAGAIVLVGGPGALSGDACVSVDADAWHFAGGATRTGEGLKLRVFNPFPEPARVTITAISDIGVEALGDLRNIVIEGRSWRDFDFNTSPALRQREELAVSVAVDEGLVVAAMAYEAGDDEAWWPGVPASASWEFPIASQPGISTDIVVANLGLAPVEVSFDVFNSEGIRSDTLVFEVLPETPLRVPVLGGNAGPVGVRVAAQGPVVAGVVGRSEAGTVVTHGAPTPARTWMLPGIVSEADVSATLHIVNSAEEAVGITVNVLTGGGVVASTETVLPGAVMSVPLDDPDAVGYLVEGSEPISVGWSLIGPDGAAYGMGTPLGDG